MFVIDKTHCKMGNICSIQTAYELTSWENVTGVAIIMDFLELNIFQK